MEFFSQLQTIIYCRVPDQKISLLQNFYNDHKTKEIPFDPQFIFQQKENFFQDNFLKIVPIQEQPVRKRLSTLQGRAELLHSILHIEYVAVDLALQSILQYPHMPRAYHEDWLEVAYQETLHFSALQAILHSLGNRYGDIPVHVSLYLAANKPKTVLERMAVVPRFLEAAGLDANPFLIERLSGFDDSFSVKTRQVLAVILKEEIGHVQKGDYWFRRLCQEENLSANIYFDMIKRILPASQIPPKKLNREARLKAGFSEQELNYLQGKSVC